MLSCPMPRQGYHKEGVGAGRFFCDQSFLPPSAEISTWRDRLEVHADQKRCLAAIAQKEFLPTEPIMEMLGQAAVFLWRCCADIGLYGRLRLVLVIRSEEHTSELQSLMRISYAVFCLIKKKN